MARYFFGSTLAAFSRSVPGIVESTTAGRFDSTFVGNAILIQGGTSGFVQSMPFIDAASTTTLWVHAELYYFKNFTNTEHLLSVYNSLGVEVAKIEHTGATNNCTLSYWNGTTFVAAGTFTIAASTLNRLDVALVAGALGTITVYLGGTQIFLQSGLNAAVTNFAFVRFGCVSTNTAGTEQVWWSQMLGADFDTRDSRLYSSLPNGNGTYTDGSGTYTDVNEAVLDDSTSIVLPAVGNKHTFTHAALTLPAGYAIDCVGVAARERVSGGTVTNAKALARSSSTDAVSANEGPGGGYAPGGGYFATDPATGAAWIQAGYNAAEFGLQAA